MLIKGKNRLLKPFIAFDMQVFLANTGSNNEENNQTPNISWLAIPLRE